jgi:DNA-binding LacI/PurR family transcriptional regulator
MKPFTLTVPLPRYGAAAALTDGLIDYLLAERAVSGEAFSSCKALCVATGLSYRTVRKALDALCREGWLEGRPGRGMFVGARVETPIRSSRLAPVANGNAVRAQLRVAVLNNAWMPARHWFFHEFLEGMESEAHASAVSIELLSYRLDRLDAARRRLAQSRPDVVIALIPHTVDIRMVAEAERLGIPCLAAGMRCPDLGLPNVYDDGRAAVADAVRRLAARGHRRIGFVADDGARQWYMVDRRHGYQDGLTAAGVEFDANLIHEDGGSRDGFGTYLKRMRPTAVVFGASWTASECGRLVTLGKIRVPRDLSVVVYDQAPELRAAFGLRVDHLAQPLAEEGRRAARLARELAEGKAPAAALGLPCAYVAGESVADVKNGGG